MTLRRSLVLVVCFLIVIALAGPAAFIARTVYLDRRMIRPLPAGFVDDASRMNAAHVREIIDVSPEDSACAAQIRGAIARARAAGVKVSIGGFQHSLGGQTIARDGIYLNMLTHNRIGDLHGGILHVQSGAVWRDIIGHLDTMGRSVEVMQSDNAFSVGGSLSVNCHGWQHQHGPIASTVEAITLMLPSGTIVRCSRGENYDLFAHALGGYGLFGVILDADLRTVPNARYRVTHTNCDVASFERTFDRVARNPSVGMAYGRICVAPGQFLKSAAITTFQHDTGVIPPLRPEEGEWFARLIFRGSVGSGFGKSLRWQLERRLEPLMEASVVSRNEVLSNDMNVYVAHGSERTDVLHEYFVPRGHLAEFIDSIRPVLLASNGDLLNVTIRDVLKDDTTALAYARTDVIAVVMFFEINRSEAADASMQALTRQLIDRVLAVGGTYYLPYRLHASDEQLRRAYTAIGGFFAFKRRIDPTETFSNTWYERYRTVAQ